MVTMYTRKQLRGTRLIVHPEWESAKDFPFSPLPFPSPMIALIVMEKQLGPLVVMEWLANRLMNGTLAGC